MEKELKDQAPEEVKEDQSAEGQSEEAKEEPTLSEVAELAKGLQKGYTLTRQELSEIRDNLQAIVEATNKQTGAQAGSDEYVTVNKLREILGEQQQKTEAVKEQADKYIDSTLAQLRAEGIIKSQEEEEALIKYAISKKEPDLNKAADRWAEVRAAREEAKKEVAKVKVRREEGSKVGTSSKASGDEQEGINLGSLEKFKREHWY